MCQNSIPSCWEDQEAHHIANEPTFEVEDKDRNKDIPEQCQYLAHKSQIYQLLKSLELEIVVRRVVVLFIILFCSFLLLFTCCSARLLSISAFFCFKSLLD